MGTGRPTQIKSMCEKYSSGLLNFSLMFDGFSFPGLRPFPCPHCEKYFRTSGHRKTHIASHFKSVHHKKHKYPRKPHKSRLSRSNLPLPDIPLQEPILITDMGKKHAVCICLLYKAAICKFFVFLFFKYFRNYSTFTTFCQLQVCRALGNSRAAFLCNGDITAP